LAIPLWAGSHRQSASQADLIGPDYAFALAAANHFLYSWQTGDLEHGTVQLSDRIRHSRNADQLEQFFSDGKDRAFEITRGHGQKGRYSFPVVLVTSRGSSRLARKFSEIVMVDSGKNDWVVNKLP